MAWFLCRWTFCYLRAKEYLNKPLDWAPGPVLSPNIFAQFADPNSGTLVRSLEFLVKKIHINLMKGDPADEELAEFVRH